MTDVSLSFVPAEKNSAGDCDSSRTAHAQTACPRLRLTCSKSVMANFWWGMQCLAVQISSLVSSAMWKWILIRMFSCRNTEVRIRKLRWQWQKHETRPLNTWCNLQSTLRRRPWCRAETSARPGRFWRARCGERRTVELSHCCTETERRCSAEREDAGRTARLETRSWSGISFQTDGLILTFRAQKMHESSIHLWVVSWRKLRRKISRCHRTWETEGGYQSTKLRKYGRRKDQNFRYTELYNLSIKT